jgi:hypothetical protein
MTIRAALDQRPWYQLATHFFRRLFDFGILSDAGADAFRRILIGIISVMLSFGLLLTRIYLNKYTALSEKYHDWGAGYLLNREPYEVAILGDGALMLAFPMLIVGFVVVLVSNSLFPDELEYRVLLPLPISKRVVFASKALAVVTFASLFAVAAQAAMMPLVILMWNSRWATDGLLAQLGAHSVASLSASIVTALVITAFAGVLMACVPRSRLQAASTAFRGASLFALVLVIPLACRLPMMGADIASESRLCYLVPPVWFLGVERWVLGHSSPYVLRLTQIAATVAVTSGAVAVGSYIFLYRWYERVIWRPATAGETSTRQHTPFLAARIARTAAVGPFIRATLTRSPLHQSVVVTIAACGAALVLNGFLNTSGARTPLHANESLSAAVVWAPFVLMFVTNIALRAALVLPIELRANWMFRLTEDEATRAQELSTVVRTLIVLGVVLPLTMLFPIGWAVLGARVLQWTSIAGLCGVILVELHMMEWRQIPFTCSYEPSAQDVGKTVAVGAVAFVLFTMIGPRLVWYSSAHPARWLGVMSMLGVVLLYLRRQRLWFSKQTTLMFEDVLPNEVEPLKLSEY